MGGKRCHHDLATGLRNHRLDNRPNLPLERGETWDIGIGAIDHEKVETLLPDACEAAKVSNPTIQRQLVHLEVACCKNASGSAANHNGQ